MSVNSIRWGEKFTGGVVELTDKEYTAYKAYLSVRNAIRRTQSSCGRLLSVIQGNILDRYYKQRYGTRLSILGQVIPNTEYHLSGDKVKVGKFTGNDGSFKWMEGKLVKVSNSGKFSEISEGNVEKARKIAMELVDNDLEAKLDKKQVKQQNWEMAMSKRNYGFNTQWTSGLNHERGN